MADHNHNHTSPVTPPDAKGALIRFTMQVIGVLLVVLGVIMVVMLISYRAADLSVNTVGSEGVPRNLLGVWGANIASILVSIFGRGAALALGLIPIIWGVRMVRKRWNGRLRFRLILMPFVLAALATVFAELWQYRGGVMAELVTWALFDYDVLAKPVSILWFVLPIRYFAVFALGFIAVLGYCYIATINHRYLIVVPFFIRAGTAFAVSVKTMLMGVKNAAKVTRKTPRRKTPPPRRDPIVIADDLESDQNATTAARRKTVAKAKQGKLDLASPGGYRLPPISLLADPDTNPIKPEAEALDNDSRLLESVLDEFGVGGEIGQARFGPVVTRYELTPAPGTKTQRVIGLADDIARSMSAFSVRIAVIPGQNTIGIELPNKNRRTVMIRDIFDHQFWASAQTPLPLALGVDISGNPVVTDLAGMPHLLVAGTTGSGKSVGVNAMILSILYTHTPETCRLIMIDPKMLELSMYDGIPHLLVPVVTDPSKAVSSLKWLVREMDDRYRSMAKVNVRNINGYNTLITEAKRKGETISRRVQTGFDDETGQPIYEEENLELAVLPYIVVIIDEVADLMLVAGKDIETSVQRLAQKARAAGIHVIMATQRPSVDVITGTIKANFPTRISFQVTSRIDSRTILEEQGAEHLLGRGDMLFREGGGRIVRVHGPFVSDNEVEAVTNFLREQGEPVYNDLVTSESEVSAGVTGAQQNGGGDEDLYSQAVALVTREGKASTSFIQRHLRIGYNRAATIIEEMEKNNVVSPANHAGKREVLIDDDDV